MTGYYGAQASWEVPLFRVGALSAGTRGANQSAIADLRGARMRWDVMPGRGAESQVVLRSSQQFDRASLIIRQLYKLEPLFEYGINVGLQLVFLRGVKTRAEQQSTQAPAAAADQTPRP